MTATLDAPATALPAAGDRAFPVTVHGTDPVTGHPGTWRVDRDAASGGCRVEWAFGHLTNPAVWMQATKVVEVVPEAYALGLLERVAR